MIEEIQGLIDRYAAWLRDKTSLREVNDDWVEITTPYLDRHNDCLQIYARRQDGGYVLTDDGWVMEDLVTSGCSLTSPKRQALLRMTLSGFGVQMKNEALEVHASADNFPLRKHNLIQAMLAVDDLFYLATPMVTSLFYEDVLAWLDLHEIRYTPRVKFTGRTGFDYLFDFVVPKSRTQPERIVQAVNRPDKEAAKKLVLAWVDTKEVRPSESRAYALLNDAEQPVSAEVVDALRSYEVRPVGWSHREEVRAELAA
jgi:hypothetical protein